MRRCLMRSSNHSTEPVSSRGIVASRVPGMTAGEPAQASGKATNESILLEGLDHVVAATGVEPADVAQERAESGLVDADQADQKSDEDSARPREPGSWYVGDHGFAPA